MFIKNEIVTGMSSYADEKELTIGKLLKLPFTKINAWNSTERPWDGKANDLKN